MKKKIFELTEKIKKHNFLYYIKNEPIISDFEYDKLLNELLELENKYPQYKLPDSPTQRFGSDILKKFEQKEHRVQMKSLDNTYSKEEIISWYNKIKKLLPNDNIEFIVELKIDGASVSLCYNDGILDYALTRGNGKTGDVVTNNIKTIYEIPLKLKESELSTGFNEIRGEIFMKKSVFNLLNAERMEIGANAFANPRNAAAGSLKQLNADISRKRKLNIFCYSIGWNETKSVNSQKKLLEELEKSGLPLNKNYKICLNIEEVLKSIEDFEKIKDELDYEIDGLVIKVNDFNQCEELGFTAKSPRYAIAYKYAADKAEAIIESVDFQVGRTGIITPVANFKPSVSISGTMVSRATLHNFDYIDELDIRIKDTVLVEKAGEIIPKVVGVLKDKRNHDEVIICKPKNCPVCNGEVHKFNEEIAVRCINPNCPAQIKERIFHFCSKKFGVDIVIGIKTIQKLLNNKIISDLADLYFITKDDILKIDGFKDKSANNLLDSIETSKKASYSSILSGIGIPLVGPVTAQLLADEFNNIEKLNNSTIEELKDIEGIGPLVAESVKKFFSLDETKTIIEKLQKAGLKLEKEIISVEGPLKNLKFVITGKMPSGISRNDLSKLIKEKGGQTYDSMSKSIDYLIAATKDSTSSKFKKAEKLNIKIITETEFYNKFGIED